MSLADMSTQKFVLVRERRAQTYKDAREECIKHGLNEEESSRFCSSADTNAIWDAQANKPYVKPVYIPKPLPNIAPMYEELGFLSEAEKQKLYQGEGLPERYKER